MNVFFGLPFQSTSGCSISPQLRLSTQYFMHLSIAFMCFFPARPIFLAWSHTQLYSYDHEYCIICISLLIPDWYVVCCWAPIMSSSLHFVRTSLAVAGVVYQLLGSSNLSDKLWIKTGWVNQRECLPFWVILHPTYSSTLPQSLQSKFPISICLVSTTALSDPTIRLSSIQEAIRTKPLLVQLW